MSRPQVSNNKGGPRFNTDFTNVGSKSSSTSVLFGGTSSNTGQIILDDEKRVINKVFDIVDKDNSGSVDVDELKEMFHLFGVKSSFLDTAITRVMTNAGKSAGDTISREEFEDLLSQKLSADDSEAEIRSIFNQLDEDKDGKLNMEELHKVAQMLGDDINRKEIKDMIKMFSTPYQEQVKRATKTQGNKADLSSIPVPDAIDLNDFLAVMRERLGAEEEEEERGP